MDRQGYLSLDSAAEPSSRLRWTVLIGDLVNLVN